MRGFGHLFSHIYFCVVMGVAVPDCGDEGVEKCGLELDVKSTVVSYLTYVVYYDFEKCGLIIL